jgi:hypothetical protein
MMHGGATANPPGGQRSDATSAPALAAEVADLAEELTRALGKAADLRWEALLDDPERLAVLADRMRGLAGGSGDGSGPARLATADDFSAVVGAIALIESRLVELEDRIRVLAEVTGTIARSVDEHLKVQPTKEREEPARVGGGTEGDGAA